MTGYYYHTVADGVNSLYLSANKGWKVSLITKCVASSQASSGVSVVSQSPAIPGQRPAPSMHVTDDGFENVFDDVQPLEDQSVDPQPLPGSSSQCLPSNAGQPDSQMVYCRPGQKTITQIVEGGIAERRAAQLENHAKGSPETMKMRGSSLFWMD